VSTTPPKPLPIRPRFSKEVEVSFLGKAELAPATAVAPEPPALVSPEPAPPAAVEPLAPSVAPPVALAANLPSKRQARRTRGPRGGTSTILASGQINLHVYVDEAEHEAIRKAAYDKDISKSDVVRAAIRAYFALPPKRERGEDQP